MDCPARGVRDDASGACSLWQRDSGVGPGPGSAPRHDSTPGHGYVGPYIGDADANRRPGGRAVSSFPFHQANPAPHHQSGAAGHRDG